MGLGKDDVKYSPVADTIGEVLHIPTMSEGETVNVNENTATSVNVEQSLQAKMHW